MAAAAQPPLVTSAVSHVKHPALSSWSFNLLCVRVCPRTENMSRAFFFSAGAKPVTRASLSLAQSAWRSRVLERSMACPNRALNLNASSGKGFKVGWAVSVIGVAELPLCQGKRALGSRQLGK